MFFKDDDGNIYLTYASFGRGGEEFLGVDQILDVVPKGRQEGGPYRSLADWVRPRNRYGKAARSRRTAAIMIELCSRRSRARGEGQLPPKRGRRFDRY